MQCTPTSVARIRQYAYALDLVGLLRLPGERCGRASGKGSRRGPDFELLG
jgi:hypothetical protein